MRTSFNFCKALSTGFIVLLLLSLLLFWLRMLCDYSLFENAASYGMERAFIMPSGLIPEEIENDPIVTKHSLVTAKMNFPNTKAIGIINYFLSKTLKFNNSNIYRYSIDNQLKEWNGLYFDEKSGLIVLKELMLNKTKHRKAKELYAGPEGISQVPEEKLGKFVSIVLDITRSEDKVILYENNIRRFFTIDFTERKVIKGPQLSKDDAHNPVQIGLLIKNSSVISDFMGNPCITDPNNIKLEKGLFPDDQGGSFPWDSSIFYGDKYLPVLDESCRIDLLDKETLEFSGTAGSLSASAPFSQTNQQQLKDLLAYRVLPIYLDQGQEYVGMVTATLNREGTDLELTVFDANGLGIKTNKSGIERHDMSGDQGFYFDLPWSPSLTIIKYLLENLQSPVFLITSYYTANSFEAGAGHRALFVLPNSFVAMKGRNFEKHFVERFCTCILLMFPSIILSVILAKLIDKDAKGIGLSDNERNLWMLSTVIFGLASYIAYRHVRPRLALVTCQNCGKTRRPDMEKCHQCKSAWNVPELTPPSWRVFDS